MTKNFFTIIIFAINLLACKKSISDNGIVNGSPESAVIESNSKFAEVTITTSASKSGDTEVFTWSVSECLLEGMSYISTRNAGATLRNASAMDNDCTASTMVPQEAYSIFSVMQ